MMQNNIIHESYLNKVKNWCFWDHPVFTPNWLRKPLKEEYLLSGKLEDTNEPTCHMNNRNKMLRKLPPPVWL